MGDEVRRLHRLQTQEAQAKELRSGIRARISSHRVSGKVSRTWSGEPDRNSTDCMMRRRSTAGDRKLSQGIYSEYECSLGQV